MSFTTNAFDTATDGTTVVTGTDGVVAVSGTCVYDDAAAVHGTMGINCGTNGAVAFAIASTGTLSYYTTVTGPGSGQGLVVGIRNTSTHLARVRVRSDGALELTDASSTVLATSAAVGAYGVPIRIDLQWTHNAGASTLALEARVFVTDPEGFQPDAVLTGTGTGVSSVPNRAYLGAATASWAATIDTVRIASDRNAWPAPFTATAAATGRPVATEGSVAWTNEGGAASIHAALADESDTTLARSGNTGTTSTRFRLGPVVTPDTAAISIKARLSAASAGTFTVGLYEGSTVRQTWTPTLTTSLSSYTLDLDPATIAAITDWSNLYVQTSWTA